MASYAVLQNKGRQTLSPIDDDDFMAAVKYHGEFARPNSLVGYDKVRAVRKGTA